MSQTISKEARIRGFFGWFFLILFWVFNTMMACYLIGGSLNLSENSPTGEVERAGYAIGATIGIWMLLFIWLTGAVILGLFAIFTRGKRYMVTEYEGEQRPGGDSDGRIEPRF